MSYSISINGIQLCNRKTDLCVKKCTYTYIHISVHLMRLNIVFWIVNRFLVERNLKTNCCPASITIIPAFSSVSCLQQLLLQCLTNGSFLSMVGIQNFASNKSFIFLHLFIQLLSQHVPKDIHFYSVDCNSQLFLFLLIQSQI